VADDRLDRSEDQDLVRLYLQDIGRYDLLTKDDEVRLAQRIDGGKEAAEALANAAKLTPAEKRKLRRQLRDGEDAKREFVNANLRLVVSIAKKYQASGLPSRSSTGARASSSRPTRPGGSVRPCSAASRTRRVSSVCPSTPATRSHAS
jgi:hypothetical protein